mgnify:FL=1
MTIINKLRNRASFLLRARRLIPAGWRPNCFRIPVMESRLLDILVCPLCKGRLEHDRTQAELVCRADRLAFPLRDGIPVMLESEARSLDDAAASS